MKIILIIYCGLLLGFLVTTVLYSCRFSLFEFTESNLPIDMVNNMFTMKEEGNTILPIQNCNCFENAMKCPPIGRCDCVALCGNLFKMVTVHEDSEIIYLNQKLTNGNYCLPKNTIKCPRQYAYTLFDANGNSTCMCKNPSIYGGKYCTEKQACLNGVLTNTTTGMPITDLDIKDQNYYCKCFMDNNGNRMINLPGDKLNCVSDPCLKYMVTSAGSIGMTDAGECNCGNVVNSRVKNVYPDDLRSPCSACFVQWVQPSEVNIPLRCLSIHGNIGYAPPCRNFVTQKSQCEKLPPVKVEVVDEL